MSALPPLAARELVEVIADASARSCVETTLCARTLSTTACASAIARVAVRCSLRPATSGNAVPSALT